MKIIESPREAMQGILPFIPTAEKTKYIQSLLRVGFDTVEVGSIVSPRAIPQMRDSLEVLQQLDVSDADSNLMMLLVHHKGTEALKSFPEVKYISYPFSLSSTFSLLNQKATLEESAKSVEHIQNFCLSDQRELVLYFSMAYGNPYGDDWSMDILFDWVDRMRQSGIRIMALSNVSIEVSSETIGQVFEMLGREFPEIEFGLHLHTTRAGWKEKVLAAYEKGCRRFDTVMNGLGGCPMAGKELLGNLETIGFRDFLQQNEISHSLQEGALSVSKNMADQVFSPLSQIKFL